MNLTPFHKEGFRYDAYGRRIQAWTPGANVLSMYSQSGQLMYQGNDRKQAGLEHIYLAGSLVAVAERPFTTWIPTIHYQHTDALGSPVATTNQAGTVIDRTSYEPYGKAIGETLDGVGYTGHVMDPVSGLVYMQQRYYDPVVGRFLSVDPMVSDMQNGWNFNRYNYAANSPYGFVDPDGRSICRRGPGEPCVLPPPMPEAWGKGGGRQGDYGLGDSQSSSDSRSGEVKPYDAGESEDGCGGLDDYCGQDWRNGKNLKTALLWSAGGAVAAESKLIIKAGRKALAAAGSGAVATWKNLSFDGPQPGARYANGRLAGVRWKGGAFGVRLDLHPLDSQGYGPAPVLHINYGPSNVPEKSQPHIILIDFNKFNF